MSSSVAISEHSLLRTVTSPDDSALAGFIHVYQEAFAGFPYFETYSPEYVHLEVWNAHMQHCIIVAEDGDVVVGLGCAHSVLADVSPSVRDFLRTQSSLPFELAKTIYMSELAVLESHRGHGIGRRIIEERFRWGRAIGHSTYVMRTANTGSNSATLYQRMGATQASFVQDVSNEGVESSSIYRQYLWGSL